MRWLRTSLAITIGTGLVLLEATHLSSARAEGEVAGQLSVECNITAATGTHSATESRYTVNGTCLFYSGNRLLEAYAVNWTANGSHQPNTKATFESMALTWTDSGKVSATGSVSSPMPMPMSTPMQCGADPWRQALGSPCRFVTRSTSPQSFSGYLSVAYDHLSKHARGLPLSVFLSQAQRSALNKQYQIAMATKQKFDPSRTMPSKPLGAAIGPPTFPNDPTINLPQGFVVKGKGVFKITPSQYLTGTHAQIQLRWLNPPANLQGKGQDFYNYEVPMNLIAGPTGIAAPDTYLAPGTWEMRVRINQPKVSDWSQPVRFEYYLQNPSAAPKSEVQFGVEGQKKGGTTGTGTSVFRPQTTPSQGMGAGTGIIRRGVDGKGGTEGNQIVDQPAEAEKKP